MQDVFEKREVPKLLPDRLEMASERGLLIPQRLGRDGEAESLRTSGLACERNMVAKLFGRAMRREVDGIAPAGNQLRWPRGGRHRSVASAAIFGATVTRDLEGRLDDRNFFRFFELSQPNLHLLTAGRALGERIEAVLDDFDR